MCRLISRDSEQAYFVAENFKVFMNRKIFNRDKSYLLGKMKVKTTIRIAFTRNNHEVPFK